MHRKAFLLGGIYFYHVQLKTTESNLQSKNNKLISHKNVAVYD